VVLAGEPYQEQQFGEDNKLRKVWVFPLKLANQEQPLILPKQLIEAKDKSREKLAKKLSNEELGKRARNVNSKVKSRTVTTSSFERDPFVTEYAKR
jgi:5-methylcytosine-specific restriction enzyme A